MNTISIITLIIWYALVIMMFVSIFYHFRKGKEYDKVIDRMAVMLKQCDDCERSNNESFYITADEREE